MPDSSADLIDIVDAHHHLWTLGERERRYPWLEELSSEDAPGPDTGLRKDYTVAELRADAKDLGALGMRLVGSVHVEAGAADGVAEALWLGDLRKSDGLPSAIVAGADLLAAGAAETLDRLAGIDGVSGVRHILNWHPDASLTYTTRNDIIRDPVWLAGFRRLAPLGLSFDAQVYPAQYEDLARLAHEHEDTTIVLDHTGMPLERDADAIRLWSSRLRSLAALPNVSIKISGLGMLDPGWTQHSIEPFVAAAIDAFGAERAMFASNFPVDRQTSTYVELYSAFEQLTRSYSAAERAALFGGTARRIYRVDPQYLETEEK